MPKNWFEKNFFLSIFDIFPLYCSYYVPCRGDARRLIYFHIWPLCVARGCKQGPKAPNPTSRARRRGPYGPKLLETFFRHCHFLRHIWDNITFWDLVTFWDIFETSSLFETFLRLSLFETFWDIITFWDIFETSSLFETFLRRHHFSRHFWYDRS